MIKLKTKLSDIKNSNLVFLIEKKIRFKIIRLIKAKC